MVADRSICTVMSRPAPVNRAAAPARTPKRRAAPGDTLEAVNGAKAVEAVVSSPVGFRSLLDIALPVGAPPENLMEQRAWAELRKLQLETERTVLELEAMRRVERDRAADPRAAHVYTFYSGVDAESVQQCMAELGTWSRRGPGSEITVIFNSPGGSVLDGLALFDYLHQLRAVGHLVTTMALGRAASMGAVLLQAGSRRVMGRNAFLLIHEVSHQSVGKVSEMEDSVGFTKRLQQRLLAILAERSTLNEREIQRRWARKEWWLDAEEALALGLADELL
ncbi:MAG: ATP-dependent Clp protease, protease subunit [Acidimicrobiaceae bacterium]|nr:ATP-dependent Clp protease, protease subunit [Acidimicrobiaceae bacterium]